MTSYEYVTMLEYCSFKELYPVFIEEFKNLPNYYRLQVLKDEPIRFRGSKQERAFYTAMCEFLTNYYHLSQPDWFWKEEYVLDKPYYPFGKLDYKQTPMEFKNRNIFIGVNDMIII